MEESPQELIGGLSDIPPQYFETTSTNPLFLAGVQIDGRLKLAKRYRAICRCLVSDLGGESEVSTAQAVLVMSAASWTVQVERLTADAIGSPDGKHDLEALARATNSLDRVLGRLGLHRRAREVNPAKPRIHDHSAAVLELDGAEP